MMTTNQCRILEVPKQVLASGGDDDGADDGDVL